MGKTKTAATEIQRFIQDWYKKFCAIIFKKYSRNWKTFRDMQPKDWGAKDQIVDSYVSC